LSNLLQPKGTARPPFVLSLFGTGLAAAVFGIIEYALRHEYDKAVFTFFSAVAIAGLLMQTSKGALPNRNRTIQELERENKLRKVANVVTRVANKKG
jgi:hypothetical protein